MKTAKVLIYEPFQTNGICVRLTYRGKLMRDFLGHKSELQEMLEKAVIYLENRKFTRLSVNGTTFKFSDYLKGKQ